MSEIQESREQPIQRIEGTPITGEILNKIATIIRTTGNENHNRCVIVEQFHVITPEGDERTVRIDNSGKLVIRGPRFSDEVDSNNPETFEFLGLIVTPSSLAAIERRSEEGAIEKARAEIKRLAVIRNTPNPPKVTLGGLG